MKADLRMGKGEFNYMKDWASSDEEEDNNGKPPPYKQMILALIADEVAGQVAAKIATTIKHMDGKVDAAIKEMQSQSSSFMKDHALSSAASEEKAVLAAKVAGLEQTVKMLQAKPQIVQTPQGKMVVQQPMTPKPATYSIDVQRGSDGLIKKLEMKPNG